MKHTINVINIINNHNVTICHNNSHIKFSSISLASGSSEGTQSIFDQLSYRGRACLLCKICVYIVIGRQGAG